MNIPPSVVQMRRVTGSESSLGEVNPTRLVCSYLQVIVECGPSHARQGCLSCQNDQTVSVDFGRKKVNP